MLYDELVWLHNNLPRSVLEMWGSSRSLVEFSRNLVLGGNGYRKRYRMLQNMEKWPIDDIEEWQYRNLKQLLDHVYKNVPFYRKLWKEKNVSPSDIRCLGDLEKIPVVTKNDIIENHDKMFAVNLRNSYSIQKQTSGTSGRPLKVHLDANTMAAMWAGVLYLRNCNGFPKGDKPVLHTPLIYPEFHLISKKIMPQTFYSPVTKQLIFPSSMVDPKGFESLFKLIKKHKIEYAEGFPSVYFAFSKFIKKNGYDVNIKKIYTIGETLYDFQRKFIEEQLGCKIFNFYGSTESVILACECEKFNGMHVIPFVIPETGGKKIGEEGELILTSLVNYIFPLIRYNIKDVASLSKKKCTCGNNFPRIKKMEGRVNDFILLPNGSFIHSGILAMFSVFIPGIKYIYFLQNKDYSLQISVVKEDKKSSKKINREISKMLRRLFDKKGSEIKFQVVFKDIIDRKSRKHRIVESRLDFDKIL